MILLNKIKEMPTYSILDYLFMTILLNIIPVFLLGVFDITRTIYTLLVGLVYVLQSVIFLFLCINKIRETTKKEFLFLSVCIINCIVSSLFVFIKYNSVSLNELIFSLTLVYNIFIFTICIRKFSITREEIIKFFEKMVILGLISVIFNLILNFKFLPSLFTASNSYNLHFGSFFPNRNQYGSFMLIMIISNTLLYSYKNEKKLLYIQILFIINLVLTMSRTSMLGLFTFFIGLLYYRYFIEKKVITKKIKKNIIIVSIVLIILTIVLIFTTNLFDTLNTLFFRLDTIKTGSGRFNLWKNGVSILKDNSVLFGTGRFKLVELNSQIFNGHLTQFHSIYLEKLFTHGIVGMTWLFVLLAFVWKQTSNLPNNIKSIVKSSFIAFLIISTFETTTRFSIGYADSIYMIFFISIPLVLSNQLYKE